MSEMKTRITSSEKESEILHQTLQNALNAQSKFQKLEALANEQVKELEVRLQEAKTIKRKNVTDCSAQTDVKITIDIASQTCVAVAEVSIQADLESQDSNRDVTVTKEEETVPFNENNQKSMFSSVLANSSLFSSSSLSALMSRYQLERDSPTPSLTQDMSDLPTQVNPRLGNCIDISVANQRLPT
uniref:Uncharacterized protein n=2 Tax=Graphocephala atropunctata TaxID=36148 RepID=A0A1B6LVV9_9HEMI